MKLFAAFSFLAFLLASALLSLVSSQEIEIDALITATPVTLSTVAQPSSTSQYIDLSQPLLPSLVNGYFLQPLANLNTQISQTASGIPNQFAQSGQSLGQALMTPIQAGASTANSFVSHINSTLISLSNGTVALVSAPVAFIGQVNTAVNGLALNALNYSTSMMGQGINNFGQSVSSAGQNVQQMGGSIMKWAQSIEQMRQQLNNSTNTTTISTTTNTTSL